MSNLWRGIIENISSLCTDMIKIDTMGTNMLPVNVLSEKVFQALPVVKTLAVS